MFLHSKQQTTPFFALFLAINAQSRVLVALAANMLLPAAIL
jgi:hypothetical protein